MPAFTFKGFTTGSSVALSAAQDASNASGSVSSWGLASVGSLDILTFAPPSMTAPAGVWFEVTNISGFAVSGGPAPSEIYDPSFHEITYIWTVRGRPLQPFDAPDNMVTEWNDPNTAYGKKVAFLFQEPGTYTVDLWAIDALGTTATAEVTLTVVDADTIYPGTRTICFSTDGDWTGEKPGCQRISSVTALQTAVDAASQPPRILFKRGQDVADMNLFVDDAKLGYLGAWGTGPRPILRPQHKQNILRIWNSYADPELTITDIVFQGDWKSETETGLPDESPFNFITNPTDCQFTVANCYFSGFTATWIATGNSHPARMIFANNVVTNWRDYGLFVHKTFDLGIRYAVIGCQIAQRVTALNGGTKNGLFNTHGPLRCADAANFYIAMTDLFSRTGWSGLNPDRADQPCIRYNHLATVGRHFNMDRCVLEGGFQQLSFGGQNGRTQENPGNFVVDKALLIATSKTSKAFMVGEFGGITVRNMLGIVPNSPAYHPQVWKGSVAFEMDIPTDLNASTKVQIYSSSFLSLRNQANDPGHAWAVETGAGIFDDVTVENNVLHAPDLDTPETSFMPISLSGTIQGVTPRYLGVLYNFDHETGTLSSNVPPGSSFTLPYPEGTDQSYWQAIQATDTEHAINVGNAYYAKRGEMSVAYESSVVRITNTSVDTWENGDTWNLKLDRTSMLPPIDSTYASPAAPLPYPVVQSDSSGYEPTEQLGLSAYTDLFGNVRIPSFSAGAIEP